MSASHVTPTPISSGNPACEDFEPDGEEWTQLKLQDTSNEGGPNQLQDGTYTDGTLEVTIDNFANNQFDWSSNIGVDAVFVKAGNDKHNLYLYDPEATEDTGLKPQAGQGNGISHISFCYDNGDDRSEPTPTPTPTPTATPTVTPTATPAPLTEPTAETCPAGTTLLVTFIWNGTAFVPLGGDAMGVSVSGDADLAFFASAETISALVVAAGDETRHITLDFPSTTGSISPHNYDVFEGASMTSLGFCTGPKVNPDSGSRVSVEVAKEAECATQNPDGTATVVGTISVENHGRWAARLTSALDTVLSGSDEALVRVTIDDLVGVVVGVDEVVEVDYAITFDPRDLTSFANFIEVTIARADTGEARHKIYNDRAGFELCEEAATPTPTPTGDEGGGTPSPTPSPTERGDVAGGNPTPTPAGRLPNTAVALDGGAVPAVALSLLLLGSLVAMAYLRLARER
ncbi:MAG: hypothetical protein M3153_09295 [Chloroflexota bacterium]|nr:hypothetical protein [Chloroflexota bacterium]